MMVMYDWRCCLQNSIHTSNMKVCNTILEVHLSKKEIKYVVNQYLGFVFTLLTLVNNTVTNVISTFQVSFYKQ